MQQPTCTHTRIRSTQDAHRLFYAVQHGRLPLLRRRLDAEERLALRPGHVYVWEERKTAGELAGLGIERFTEGRQWSQSRVREEFFFYYEKYQPPQDVVLASTEEPKPPKDWEQLVKQTYSVTIPSAGHRKWHITAYFTQATVDQLQTIDALPELTDIPAVPADYCISTRTTNRRQRIEDLSRRQRDPSAHSGAGAPLSPGGPAADLGGGGAGTSGGSQGGNGGGGGPSVPRTYAAFPAAYSASAAAATSGGAHDGKRARRTPPERGRRGKGSPPDRRTPPCAPGPPPPHALGPQVMGQQHALGQQQQAMQAMSPVSPYSPHAHGGFHALMGGAPPMGMPPAYGYGVPQPAAPQQQQQHAMHPHPAHMPPHQHPQHHHPSLPPAPPPPPPTTLRIPLLPPGAGGAPQHAPHAPYAPYGAYPMGFPPGVPQTPTMLAQGARRGSLGSQSASSGSASGSGSGSGASGAGEDVPFAAGGAAGAGMYAPTPHVHDALLAPHAHAAAAGAGGFGFEVPFGGFASPSVPPLASPVPLSAGLGGGAAPWADTAAVLPPMEPPRAGSVAPAQAALAPLHVLESAQPYRRERADEDVLRMLKVRDGM